MPGEIGVRGGRGRGSGSGLIGLRDLHHLPHARGRRSWSALIVRARAGSMVMANCLTFAEGRASSWPLYVMAIPRTYRLVATGTSRAQPLSSFDLTPLLLTRRRVELGGRCLLDHKFADCLVLELL
jgi:hypothetical protein